jgi:hypothetical protein
MGDGVDVAWERRTEELVQLRVGGRLRPGWCGNLATGLAARGVDVVSGRAVTVAVGQWSAEFQLRCSESLQPSRGELVRLLVAEARAGFATPIRLVRYSLERSESHGGSLALEVAGLDELGFLAALMRRLAYFSLFPVELQLETVGPRVRDRLWLRGAGGRRPSPRAERALRASLDAHVSSQTAPRTR